MADEKSALVTADMYQSYQLCPLSAIELHRLAYLSLKKFILIDVSNSLAFVTQFLSNLPLPFSPSDGLLALTLSGKVLFRCKFSLKMQHFLAGWVNAPFYCFLNVLFEMTILANIFEQNLM